MIYNHFQQILRRIQPQFGPKLIRALPSLKNAQFKIDKYIPRKAIQLLQYSDRSICNIGTQITQIQNITSVHFRKPTAATNCHFSILDPKSQIL